MRVRLLLGSLGLLALVALVAPAALTGCSASGGGSALPNDPADAATSPGASSLDGGKPSSGGAGGGDGATPPPANACNLPDIKNVANVIPTFVTYAAPDAVPPTMTGGTLDGNYLVDKATVFLPSGTAGLADPKKSTGTVNAWAVFSGTNYRLYLNANFTIDSVLGPQSQGTNTASQGAFMVSGAAITLDHACDTTLAQEADYSFTDTGAGRATILIKVPSTYGDTYMQLDAAKN